MGRGVAHRHDRVAGAHQRRQPIEIVGVVDIGQALDRNAQVARKRRAFRAGVAILQVDEAAARKPQQRCKIQKPRALRRATDRRLADPGQPDHETAVARQALPQRLRAASVGNQIAPLAVREIIPARPQETAKAAERLLCINLFRIELRLAANHLDGGKRSREQRRKPRLDLEHH